MQKEKHDATQTWSFNSCKTCYLFLKEKAHVYAAKGLTYEWDIFSFKRKKILFQAQGTYNLSPGAPYLTERGRIILTPRLVPRRLLNQSAMDGGLLPLVYTAGVG